MSYDPVQGANVSYGVSVYLPAYAAIPNYSAW